MNYQEIRAQLNTEPFWEIIPDGLSISGLIPALFEGKICDCVFLYGRALDGTSQGPYRRIQFDPVAREVLEVQDFGAPQTLAPVKEETEDHTAYQTCYEDLYSSVRRLFEARGEGSLSTEEGQQIARFLWALYYADPVIYPWYALVSEEFFSWAAAAANQTEGK